VANQGTEWGFALNPYSHTYNYVFGDTPKDVMLVTPLLDLSSLETATLGIFHRIYAYGEGWSHKILMSPDGVNWETLTEFTEGFNPDINLYMEFEIPQQAKALGQIYLAFEVDYPVLPDYYEVVWEIVDVEVFEPIPTFNVSFAVEDEDGNPLNNAVVALDGNTNAAGDYLFDEIEPGTYDYTVELDGYITAEGQVEVVDQDVEETVVLQTGEYVNLTEGWSLISSNIAPYNPLLEHIFSKPMQNESVVIMLNNSGIFWPGFNINTIGNWNTHSGYKIKMAMDDIAGIPGEPVENKTVELTAGINYLPVLSALPVSAEDIFSQIENELGFAFDLSGGLIYWPEGEVYTLETLEPGKAYLLGMNAPGTVTFMDTDLAMNNNRPIPQIDPTTLLPIVKTGTAHLIAIDYEALQNILEPGDYLAAFDNNGRCAGAIQYDGAPTNPGLIIYGDDPTTDHTDGMVQSEIITLKCVKYQSGEVIDVEPSWNNSMPDDGYFTENGLSGITGLKLETLGFDASANVHFNIYPNPARDQIGFDLQGVEFADAAIIDQLGQMVWNGRINTGNNTINVSHLASGVYFVKVSSLNKTTRTLKLIIE
jgi:hypothetical protein